MKNPILDRAARPESGQDARELGCRGAVVRTTGLRLPLGHRYYDPIYHEAETLGTWLPYWLDRMDEHWEKRGKIETPSLKQRPSDCVRQHPIFFSLEAEERLLPETFSYVGENHFVYATHIPHWDCEFPANLHHTQEREDLSDETKNKIFYENVKAIYGI